jgi:hypothetical protein
LDKFLLQYIYNIDILQKFHLYDRQFIEINIHTKPFQESLVKAIGGLIIKTDPAVRLQLKRTLICGKVVEKT